jgi:cellulose synthase/poly-beta-1,6-N-acetylglucosamine synthase-like glycosyltransferase
MTFFYDCSLGLIGLGIILFIYASLRDLKKIPLKLKKHKDANCAVVIPARDESAVIEKLIISLKNQTIPNDIYIIVESKSDKTCKIAEKYGANIYVRHDIKEKKRKGFALDEFFKDLLDKKDNHDLYFIFDADNVLENDYLEKMIPFYEKGYQIATGFRNIKNSTNVITTCSGLTFSLINELINKFKMYHNRSIIISGTGFYIDSKLIKKWNGFPFYSLTEDYELSLWCSEHNISTYYNDKAMFYDEQPTDMETSIKQRTRWVRGFLEARAKRIDNIKNDWQRKMGIIPYLFMLMGIILFMMTSFIGGIICFFNGDLLFRKYLVYFFLPFVIVYVVLFMITYYLIITEIDDLAISGKETIKALFYNPIFLLTYIHCFFKAIFTKNTNWEKIEHK